MDVLGILGMVLTYVLTLLLKKNPSMKDHAPLVVTVLSTVLAALQAAVAAATANAAGVDSVAVAHHAASGGFLVALGKYAVENAAGSVLVHNALEKWIGQWLFGTVLKRLTT